MEALSGLSCDNSLPTRGLAWTLFYFQFIWFYQNQSFESFIFSGIWSLCAASPGNGSQRPANECQSAGFGNFTTDTSSDKRRATVNMHHSFWHRAELWCHAPSDALRECFAFVVRIFMWSAFRSDHLLVSFCSVLSKLKVNVYQSVGTVGTCPHQFPASSKLSLNCSYVPTNVKIQSTPLVWCVFEPT